MANEVGLSKLWALLIAQSAEKRGKCAVFDELYEKWGDAEREAGQSNKRVQDAIHALEVEEAAVTSAQGAVLAAHASGNEAVIAAAEATLEHAESRRDDAKERLDRAEEDYEEANKNAKSARQATLSHRSSCPICQK